jgi:hypothetical protein
MDGFTTLDEKVKIKKTHFISFHILPIWGLKKMRSQYFIGVSFNHHEGGGG